MILETNFVCFKILIDACVSKRDYVIFIADD